MSLPDDNAARQKPNIFIIGFEVDHKPKRNASGAEIAGEVREVHKVRWSPRGNNKSEVVQEVERLKKHEPMMWEVIGPAYERWLAGQTEPADGTPLSAWSGVNKAQVEVFRLIGVRTVEDAAEMNESTMQAFGMGARGIKGRAQAFLDSKPQAQMAADLAARDAQIASQATQIAELTASVKALAEQQGLEERRKPGRPPKQQEAA